MTDSGEPAFEQARDALMPPGTDGAALRAALKGAQRPGVAVPDISKAPGSPEARAVRAIAGARQQEACCVCGSPQVAYRNYQDKPFCAPCADGRGASAPADPFARAGAPSVALAEMYWGMIRAGIPRESVDAQLGHMLADHGRDDGTGWEYPMPDGTRLRISVPHGWRAAFTSETGRPRRGLAAAPPERVSLIFTRDAP